MMDKTWNGYEVITEGGRSLGRVQAVHHSLGTPKSRLLQSLPCRFRWLPEFLVGSHELPDTEVVSIGPRRIIVNECAEENLVPVTIGLFERCGLGRFFLDRASDDQYYVKYSVPSPISSNLPLDVYVDNGDDEPGADTPFPNHPRNPEPHLPAQEAEIPKE